MNYSIYPYKRSISILFFYLHTLISWNILHKKIPQKSLNKRSNYHNLTIRYLILRLCFTMGTNILLSGSSNHKFNIHYPISRKRSSKMSMGGLLSKVPYSHTILFFSLSTTIHSIIPNFNSSNFFTWTRIKKQNGLR